MPPKRTTRNQKKKQSIIPVDEDEVVGSSSNYASLTIAIKIYIGFLAFSLVPKENQELEAALAQKPPAKRRGRKRKVPVVEDDEATNDNDQQIEAPALKTTAKRKTVATKRKTVATAPKTTAKRQRKESVSDDDNIQENESLDEDDDIHQESTAAATTKPAFVINKLLELSDNDDNLSEGNFSYF